MAVLNDAFKNELCNIFHVFVANIAGGMSPEEAAQRFARGLATIKIAYDKASPLIDETFK